MSWRNPEGYELKPSDDVVNGIRIWHFRLLDPPLQWLREDGRILEPCRDSDTTAQAEPEDTDGGSVPWWQKYIDRWAYPRAFPLHDINYRHGFSWIQRVDGSWHKIYFDRAQCDQLLFEQCLADGATLTEARVVWAAVRAFGWIPWAGYRRADAIKAQNDGA